jgi:hypothetical protein
MFFICLFSLFLYFGSGASASSESAIITGNIITVLFVFTPILFNFYKMYHLNKAKLINEFNSYLSTQIFITLFIIFHFYIDFILISI